LCSRLYPIVRNQVLEDRAWTFATDRDTLLPDATAPAFGYGQRFLIPTEWIRILWVSDKNVRPGQENVTVPLEWNREGRYILANASKVYVKYVKEVTDTSQFSPAFSDALAYRLASEMCNALRESRALFADLMQVYNQKMIEAALTDGGQGRRQEKYRGSYVLRR